MQTTQPQIRTASLANCKLCGAAGDVLYEALRDPFFNAPGTWRMKRCPNAACGLLWLDPAPLPEDLPLAYKQYFTHGQLDAKQSLSGRMRSVFYAVYQKVSSLPATFTGLESTKTKALRMYLHDRPPGRLLDVGCGDGLFLSRMRALGWKVDGVDFDERAIANAKLKHGLDLRAGDLKSAGFAADTFEAVTMSHVIEHVPEPGALFAEALRILKPGGQLVVTTPNADSMGHKIFKQFWFGVDAPRHLQLFSVNALQALAERTGFIRVRTFSTAANADIFIGASYSIKDSADHRTNDQPPPNLLRTWRAVATQYREHRRLETEPHCGEEVVLICRKAEQLP